ncbi:MAG TPA: TetR family transcriptional regulator C-terminal domain-containing protein [Candidatus Krumholzibacteria bacterium]|nr:TetR family transcriptional regulator C-terminal domain-containing protein [Candidatus Krumholzibacteria bacterium]
MPAARKPTADRVLDIAEALVQTRGYNAFSYADISRAVGVRKASLHHHYPTKADLGLALVARYHAAFMGALGDIDAKSDSAPRRLERYTELYGAVLRKGRMCMCGMLAADVATLPKPMRESIAGFFAGNEQWLTRVLTEGKKRGEIAFEGTPSSMASFFVSSLEGAMLVARGSGNPEPFDDVVRHLMARIQPAAEPRPRRRK